MKWGDSTEGQRNVPMFIQRETISQKEVALKRVASNIKKSFNFAAGINYYFH